MVFLLVSSFVFFIFAVCWTSTEAQQNPDESSNNLIIYIILGVSIGFIFFCLIIFCLRYLYLKKRRRRRPRGEDDPETDPSGSDSDPSGSEPNVEQTSEKKKKPKPSQKIIVRVPITYPPPVFFPVPPSPIGPSPIGPSPSDLKRPRYNELKDKRGQPLFDMRECPFDDDDMIQMIKEHLNSAVRSKVKSK